MKQTFNSVDFFRFSDGYEDVFVEDDCYLYAYAEPYDFVYELCVNEYRILEDGTYLRYDTSSAQEEYLLSLTPAPEEIAKRIIKVENRRMENILDGIERVRGLEEHE